jgi:cell wall assembly regulator SMI1
MKRYYIHDGQMEKGPFNFEQLRSQSLKKETPVWHEGLENWAKAGNVDELNELFILKTIPPPLPGLFEKNIALRNEIEKNVALRNEILNSFTDAPEIVPQPRKKSILGLILIFLIIVGILLLI